MPPEPRPPAEEAHQQAWAADCKRPGARCFNPAAATRIGRLSRPPKSDAKRASHASGATTPSSKGGAPTGAGRIAKDLGPAVSIPQPQQGSAGSPACQKRCEASKPCRRSHNALQQRRRTNRHRADCKRPGSRCSNPAAAARIRWLSRPPNAMRSEQAMPPEPQRPPAEQAHQQARGRGSQKTRSPLFLTQPAARTRWLSHLPNAMRSEQAMPPEPQPPLVKGARRQARGCGGQRARGPLFCTASAVRNNGAFPARQAGKAAEPACKPGSVVDSHSSRRHVTVTLEQPTRTRRGPRH